MGNRFLSIFIRVFRAPDRASGQLFEPAEDAYSQDTVYRGQEDEEDTPYLVEAQLREGDRLHFSALFPEIMREFKVDILDMHWRDFSATVRHVSNTLDSAVHICVYL